MLIANNVYPEGPELEIGRGCQNGRGVRAEIRDRDTRDTYMLDQGFGVAFFLGPGHTLIANNVYPDRPIIEIESGRQGRR